MTFQDKQNGDITTPLILFTNDVILGYVMFFEGLRNPKTTAQPAGLYASRSQRSPEYHRKHFGVSAERSHTVSRVHHVR